MSKSELISFFDNAENYTNFEIRKKIYELTNNLDIDLIYDLQDEYIKYCFAMRLKMKLEAETENQYENELNVKLNDALKNDSEDKKSIRRIEVELDVCRKRKIYVHTFLMESKRVITENENVDSVGMNKIITDLLRRKMSDVPENSRHKNNFNYSLRDKENEDDFDLYSHEEILESEEVIDLSDTSIIGKIIYLEKLGIIEHLRSRKPFNTSVNSIATVLSAVTGAKATSIQPLLNPLLNNDVANKNNPLFSKKNVLTVENLLSKIGFDIFKK